MHMLIDIGRLIVALFAVIFIGWNILLLLTGRKRGAFSPEFVALAYGIGWGCLTLEMLIFHFLGIRLSVAALVAPWIVVSIAAILLPAGDGSLFEERFGANNGKHALLGVFFASFVGIEAAYAFFRALIKPIEAYDAVAIYAIKSKIFYLAHGITREYLSTIGNLFPHPDYPLNIPLAETFIYLALGRHDDQLVKIIFPLFFAATLIILYYAVRRFASKTYALMFVFILASVPQFSAYAANAYLDLPLAYYVFVSSVFLFEWLRGSTHIRFLVLSAVFAALAGWTKNEGLMFCVVNWTVLAAASLFRKGELPARRAAQVGIYGLIIALISLPWVWIKVAYRLTNSDVDLARLGLPNLIGQLWKIGPILYEFQKQILGPKKWNIVWILFLISIIARHRRAFAGVGRYMAAMLALTVSGYIVFYLISSLPIGYFLGTTWSRFLIHFLPVAIYWMAYTVKEDVPW